VKPLNEKPDLELNDVTRDVIESSIKGDRQAQYQLYRMYAKAMYNICLRMMHNREEAEDMLQESFSEAFRRIGSFRYDSTFGAWLKRIVINRCINELTRKRTKLEYFEDMSPFDETEEKMDEELPALSVDIIRKAMEQRFGGIRDRPDRYIQQAGQGG